MEKLFIKHIGIVLIILSFSVFLNLAKGQYIINTIAGNGTPGYTADGISAITSALHYPIGIAKDTTGNIYISDYLNNRIRKVDVNGNISTIAGDGTGAHTGDNGLAVNSEIYNPAGLAVDIHGNIYFAETGYHVIRKIDNVGIITTIAGSGPPHDYTGDGGLAINAKLFNPYGIALDNAGNIYFTDRNNHCVRKINSGDSISTVAGKGPSFGGYSGDNGLADSAMLQYPSGVSLDNAGNIYIADTWNNVIRKVNSGDSIFTISGSATAGYNGDGGLAVNALLNHPYNVFADATGNVFVADYNNNVIRVIKPDNNIYPVAGSVQGFYGDGGLGLSAKLYGPISLFVDNEGTIFFSDFNNNRVRTLIPCNPPIITTSIVGNNLVCPNSTQIFSINVVPGATSYSWALPAAWTGSSSTDSITANVLGNFSGFVRVTANNLCGSSNTVSLYDSVNSVPTQPGAILGNALVCSGAIQTYSINPISNATSYSWSFPNGWAGNSTTNSLTLIPNDSNGIISVNANNVCGSSYARTMTVTTADVPSQPTTILGLSSICSNTSEIYLVAPVLDATSYFWSLPLGWTGTSSSDSITINCGTTGGSLTVTANNFCGSGTPQSLLVNVRSTLQQPGTIAGNSTPCFGTTQTYSVVPVACATNYIWSLPNGWSGNSTTNTITTTVGTNPGIISVMANNGSGNSQPQNLIATVLTTPSTPISIYGLNSICQNTAQTYSVSLDPSATNYTWNLPGMDWTGNSTTNILFANSGITSGNISVSANNVCGNSIPQILNINVNLIPSNPGAISGNTSVTVGSQQTYSITPVSGATGYIWTLPNNWFGTSFTDSITSIVGASMGIVTVFAENACGNSSQPGTLGIYVNSNTSSTNYIISTCAGDSIAGYTHDNVAATLSSIDTAVGVAKDAQGNLFIADYRNHRIRKVDIYGIITTIAGTGVQGFGPDGVSANQSKLSFPTGVAVDSSGNIFIADNGNNRIRKINANNNIITTIAGNTGAGFSGDGGKAINSYLNSPYGIAVDNLGNIIFGDRNNHCVRRIATNDTIKTIAGIGAFAGYSGDNGPSDSAHLKYPSGVAVDFIGNVYIADTWNNCIRKVNTSGVISTIANKDTTQGYSGDGDSATRAHLNTPYGVAVDPLGNIFIADEGNNLIRKITSDGIIHPIAGTTFPGYSGDNGLALSAKLKSPIGICVDATGKVFIGDYYNSRIRQLTPCNTPAITSSIVGDTLVCPNSSQLYTLDTNGIGATNYSWVLPNGWSGTPNVNSILVTPNSNPGNIQITASNVCGSSSIALPIHINHVPAQPAPITGNLSFCNGSSQAFSIPIDSNASGYIWTLPLNWTGSSSTNSINAIVHDSSGLVSVIASNICGNSIPRSLSVSVNYVPPTPVNISGPLTICAGSVNIYSIATVPTATSFNWTLPTGWSGTSSSNSISAIAGTFGGNIQVSANNICGNGTSISLPVTVTTIPSTPSTIYGNTTLCANTISTYYIHSIPCATSYTWTLPNGWTGSSNDTLINIVSGSNGGTISVTANNGYGSSGAQTIATSVITIPAQPSAIIGNATFCQGTTQTFSVSAVSGATSYTWTLPNGWTGISTLDSITALVSTNGGIITVTANNSCGSSSQQSLSTSVNLVPPQPGNITGPQAVCQGTTQTYYIASVPGALSYAWSFPGGGWSTASSSDSINAIVGSNSGHINVQAINACGASAIRFLAVSVTLPPAQPGPITGTDTVCINISNVVYSIAPVSGATSYIWSVPSVVTLNSGQGTTSISVNAGNIAGNGIISVKAYNVCDSSLPQTIHLYVISIPQTIVTPPSGINHICRGAATVYTAPSNPDATYYTWSKPGNWLGSSNADTIAVTIGLSSGFIQMTAHNLCGSSAGGQLYVTVDTAVPPRPDTIIGSRAVCQNSIHLYKTHAIPNATTYQWTLPSTWTGNSNADTISAIASANGGYMYVNAVNTCGIGPKDSAFMTINPAPTVPVIQMFGNILGTTSTAVIYKWYRNDTLIANSDTNQITPTVSGNYYLVVFDSLGCSSQSNTYNFLTTSGNELSINSDYFVFPNPNNGQFIMAYHYHPSATSSLFKITDVMGRRVFQTSLSGAEGTRAIDVSKLDNGIYYWEVLDCKGMAAKGKIAIIK